MKTKLVLWGAKRSILALQLALIFNSYLVTGAEGGLGDSGELLQMEESRVPYIVLPQREYIVEHKPNVSTEKTFTAQLKQQYETTTSASEDVDHVDQDDSASITSTRFESPYVRYSISSNDNPDYNNGGGGRQQNVHQVLEHRQGYSSSSGSGGYASGKGKQMQSSASGTTGYDDSNGYTDYPAQVSYHSVPGYEVPSNYFPGPSDQLGYPESSYGGGSHGGSHGGHQGSHGGGHGQFPLSPFLGSIAQITSSVKNTKAILGEQKANTAYQVGDAIKHTGYAVNSAILDKGHTAAAIVGNTVETAGQLLRNKGATATKVIQGSGQLASSAIKSVGNIGSSILRTKGELVGAVLRTGSELGTAALGTASNGLQKGTYLVKAKGDAASNLIAKGGRLASGVINTKGRLITSVINAKSQFTANIIEAKGRAAATLLETGGQKLYQLADAIKGVTAKKVPGNNYGWSEQNAEFAPASKEVVKPQPVVHVQTEAPIQNYQQHHQQMDYADAYYDPRDHYNNNNKRQASNNKDEDNEDIQNDYSSYYGQQNQQQRQAMHAAINANNNNNAYYTRSDEQWE